VAPVRLGLFEINTVSDGDLWMDGGAMFGVVPRPLWERLMAPDERHRVRLATNCLLARLGTSVVLIEAGIGRRFSKKRREIYGLTDEVTLETSLRAAGVEPDAVTDVVLTHLHFDHCGGATRRSRDGDVVPTFPNARHWIQRTEWDEATHPTPATDTSYDLDLLAPLEAAGLVELLDGDAEIVPGVRAEVIAGHTRSHQVVRIESDGQVLVFVGDLIPTSHHIRTHYNAAYDLNAEANMLNKRAFLDRACEHGWRLHFYHDPQVPQALVVRDSAGRFAARPLDA
jgi:glyoxylase-like metal-dependent hydrolase (beta-lactamase superfamily II)